MANLIFKGIQQVFASGFTAENATNGVLYFVRNAETGDAEIYFGKKHYGSLNATQLAGLEASIKQNTDDIAAIEALLGDFSNQMTSNIKTVAQVTKANADAIGTLKDDITSYTGTTNTTLTKLRTDVDAVSGTASNNATAITNLQSTKLDVTTHKAYTASTKSVLDDIQESLSSITNNAVTSVGSSGSTITVTEDKGAVNVEVNTLAHAESGQDGYVILNKTNNGALYGVMYYGGDDAE